MRWKSAPIRCKPPLPTSSPPRDQVQGTGVVLVVSDALLECNNPLKRSLGRKRDSPWATEGDLAIYPIRPWEHLKLLNCGLPSVTLGWSTKKPQHHHKPEVVKGALNLKAPSWIISRAG